jgi:hypothetical protein
MAETRRVSSAPSQPRRAARPRLPHPPRALPAPRLRADETLDPRLPERVEEAEPPAPRQPEPAPAAVRPPRFATLRPPRRTPTERVVLTVLVLGLLLNALALLRHAALSRADILLGTTVLLAGLALLVLIEVYRRTER